MNFIVSPIQTLTLMKFLKGKGEMVFSLRNAADKRWKYMKIMTLFIKIMTLNIKIMTLNIKLSHSILNYYTLYKDYATLYKDYDTLYKDYALYIKIMHTI